MSVRNFLFFVFLFFMGINVVSANSALTWNATLSAYEIHNCTELQNVSLNLSGSYALVSDIDCSETSSWNSGAGFNPISTFTGNFKGYNKVISNLYMSRSGTNYQGLFGQTSTGAIISNVVLENVSVTGSSSVGGLVGYLYRGTVINSSSSGSVTGVSNVGGLIGYLSGNAYSYYVSNSSSSATVYGTGNSIGGLIGYQYYYCEVSDSHATGSVTGTGSYTGGLIGYSYERSGVYRSYATGSVVGVSYVGGLIGYSDNGRERDVYDCYATGNVTGSGSYIGGLIGRVIYLDLYRSYSTGFVRGAYFVGGLIGNDGGANSVTASFWDVESSGTNVSAFGTGKTTTQMRTIGTFTGASGSAWTFTTPWSISDSKNYGYPYLTSQDQDVQSVRTERAININYSSALLRGTLTYYNGESDVFFQYRIVGTSAWTNTSTQTLTGTQVFNLTVSDLVARRPYEFRAVANWSETDLEYGEIFRFVTSFSAGSGIVTDPYQISNISELQDIDNTSLDLLNKNFVLKNSINASLTNNQGQWDSNGFDPIGDNSNPFRGTFDGRGYNISNLYISRTGTTEVGLFGKTVSPARINNTKLFDVSISGSSNTGGLVGYLYQSALDNSTVNGTVVGIGSQTGGLVGYSYYSAISRSSSSGSVTGVANTGGLVGYYRDAGYIASLTNSSSSSTVYATGSQVGGLVGSQELYNYILDSHATGSVTSTGSYIGGLIGYSNNRGGVERSYATGNVVGVSYVGGLIGYSSDARERDIFDCYSTGNVTGSGSYIGGLIGRVYYLDLLRSYSTGFVTGVYFVGGLIGNDGGANSVTASFWDVESSGTNVSAFGTGKTTTQMRTIGTFTGASGSGWDFVGESGNGNNDYWSISDSKNYGYPYLTSQDQDVQSVRTERAININYSSALLRGTLTYYNGESDVFFQYRIVGTSAWTNTSTQTLTGTQVFNLTVSDLVARRPYEFRAVANWSETDLEYGEIFRFVTSFSAGSGIVTDPYQISNISELQDIDNTSLDLLNKNFVLKNNINASLTNNQGQWDSNGFDPIGDNSNPFRGTFDGRGYNISNLYISRTGTTEIGLFGRTVSPARINNTNLLNVSISGSSNTGGLVGYLYQSALDNSTVNGTVVGIGSQTGGLVGYSYYSAISRSSSSGSVTGVANTGGLVGAYEDASYIATLTNSSSSATVYATGSQVGGLVGYQSQYNYILDSHATGSVTGTGSYTGGLIGYSNNRGGVERSYATGNVVGVSYVGGLIGYSNDGRERDLFDCYATGNVTGSGSYIGGLIGRVIYLDLYRSYSTGFVTGGSSGGLIGNNGGVSTATNCFWDNETSNQSTSALGTGKTTALMKDITTFNSTWNFSTIWNIDNNSIINTGYPYLRWIVAADRTAPAVEVVSVVNGSYVNNSNQTVAVNVSENLALQNYTISVWNQTGDLIQTITGAVIGTVTQIVDYIANLVEGVFTWNLRVCDFAGNCETTDNRTFIVDLTYPLIEFSATNPIDQAGQTGSFILNVSINESNVKNISYSFNGEVTRFRYNGTSLTNTSVAGSGIVVDSWNLEEVSSGVYYFTLEQGGLIPAGNYYYNISVYDKGSNYNITETRLIRGNTLSSLGTISYSPTSLDDLDPNETISFEASVYDAEQNFDYGILQWKNSSQDWEDATNETMINTTEKGLYTTIFGSFTPLVEGDYNVRIAVVDEVNDTGYSDVYNLSVFWDCSWNVTPTSLGTEIGFDERLTLGNLTIFNTGDSEYSTGCNLYFRITHSLGRGRFWFDGSSIKPSDSYFLSTGENVPVLVEATFLSERIEETPTITLDELNEESNSFSKNVSVTLISTPPGPYFLPPNSITENPSVKTTENPNVRTEIPLTFGEYNISVRFENRAGGTYASHDTNISLIIPGDFKLGSESEIFLGNISDSNTREENITLIVDSSNIDNFVEYNSNQSNIYNIYFLIYALNDSFAPALSVFGDPYFNFTIPVSFYCPEESEDAPALVCRPTTIEIPGEGTAGITPSGGGGQNPGGKQERSEAEFELVIGKQQEFQLPIKNKYPNKLTDLRVSVSGINSEYVSISPEVIKEIPGNSEKNITIKINAPSYFREGNYTLRFKIDGFVESDSTKSPYTENKVVTLFILDISREEASVLLDSSRSMIEEMNNSGLFIRDVSLLLKEIESSFSSTAFSRLSEAYFELKVLYESAFEGLALREELKAGIETAEKNGVSVIETKKLLYLAEAAFERGAYKEALERFKEAKLTYAVETKGEFNIIYYVKNNPLQALGILIGISLFGYGGSLGTRYQILKRRLRLLKQEQVLLLGLMKVVQRECFELAHMSMEEYEAAMSQYETRLSQAVEEEIRAETGLAHLGKLKGKDKALKMERDRLIDLVKKIQEKYLVKGEIETRIYHNMLQSYSKRLVEIEEEMTFLEAKEYLAKKGLRIGR